MTEDDARDWVRQRLSEEQFARTERFVALVIAENERQNLIAPGTIPTIWSRHVLDSLQLREFADTADGAWLDIGTGGGFPGMVLAIAGCTPMMLVEPRRRRADFLRDCLACLGLTDVSVADTKVEQVSWKADVITARAVASVEKLLLAAAHCCTPTTRWLLPRGTLDAALLSKLSSRKRVFHVKQSLTQSESAILVIEGSGR
ncbi:16S rRNA (guanine(527)-N(7))-methyltransferase RsmG [Sphingomonas sp. KR1UV-12]|uniref:Ribosomal RNA small subunit methyltransferase G n=1 Tax=Sphingomonas aurea TaxID=3063994 RepID=A0ABT9ELX5_9SPHN|nr:16S rRNA (guanine(527)-N(7))-methyltransferase RsmG [Sphingomonas sp. KR1UV-12]MDP1027811.1 16S rRNA (guanine(527)-N(7))-methyltransferase RsmG [Sphingomonas sp. KR1UV-12]